ncbi:MAG: hypothetical protein ACYDCQ_10935 [Dehalococcoidia bacterium]
MTSDPEESLKRYEAGDVWEADDEVVEISAKRPLDKVIPIRLSADKWDAIRREATELGVGPSTLVRMWVLEKLREVRLAARQGDAARP